MLSFIGIYVVYKIMLFLKNMFLIYASHMVSVHFHINFTESNLVASKSPTGYFYWTHLNYVIILMQTLNHVDST